MRALPRWSISFADLALLLLCFFVLLQAGDRQQVAAGARAAFGDVPIRGPLLDETAARLFEPGEARLTVAARLRILDLARSAGASPSRSTAMAAMRQHHASMRGSWLPHARPHLRAP
jgi:hypothetical protein